MIYLIKHIHLFSVLFLLSCAAIGPPSGGRIDKDGPSLLSIDPKPNTILSNDKKIIFEFDELIDPISVPNSIKINSNIKYKIKILGRKIVLKPDKYWPNNDLIKITISRKIKDYQKNKMGKPINIIYSTGDIIPGGGINGKIFSYSDKQNPQVFNKEKLIEIGLYSWPVSDTSDYIQKVEVDNSGFFQFNGLYPGEYTLAGVEGILNDFNSQIKKKPYTQLTDNFISINEGELYNIGKMYLSKPIERRSITSIEMLSQYSFNLLMNDNSKNLFMIDSIYIPGDTISIQQKQSNHIETYITPKYSFILPEIQDTVPPNLLSATFNREEEKFKIIFSEPVNVNYNAILANKDSSDFILDFIFESQNSLVLPKLDKTIKNIQLFGNLISDWSGNNFIDSIKTIKIYHSNINSEKISGGNILGAINYNGKESIIIKARNINNNTIFNTESYKNKFKFENLPADLYVLWGFEKLNNQNDDIYFSGTWNPYKRAAKFSFLSDTIDVRSRWDIEGIIIDID